MKKFKLFPLILIICLVLSVAAPTAAALEDPQLPAKAAVLLDMNTGRILYSLNADEKRAPASLTKIMTVLLALEAVDRGEVSLDEMITAQADCRTGMDESSSTSGIQPGAQVSMRELLYCAMLQSANEACNIIASRLSGSIDSFVGRMNQRAAELGCVNTNFVTTNGLSAEGHYSTAYDLSLITREAMKHSLFVEISNTLSHVPESEAVNAGETMYNSNALLHETPAYPGDYVYEYASGVKTGYTRAAGYCLISTAEKEDINVLAVVMGCDGWLNASIETYRNFEASITLYDWAFDNFGYRTVLSSADPIQKVNVELAKGDGLAILRPQEDVTLLLPTDIDSAEISTAVTVYEDKLVAPIEAGTVLGEARIIIGEEDYGTVRLVNGTAVELAKGEFIKQKLIAFFSNGWVIALIVVVLLFASTYLTLVIRYRRLRKRHLEERRLAEQRRRKAREEQEMRNNGELEFEEFFIDFEK